MVALQSGPWQAEVDAETVGYGLERAQGGGGGDHESRIHNEANSKSGAGLE